MKKIKLFGGIISIAGAVAIPVGVAFIYLPAGIIVAGMLAMFVGYSIADLAKE